MSRNKIFYSLRISFSFFKVTFIETKLMSITAWAQYLERLISWMRRSLKVLNLENPNGNQYSDRITLDTIEDYKKISEIFNEISITNNE